MVKRCLLGVLFSAGLLTSLYYNFYFFRKIKSSEKERIVIDVLDGDTFIFANDQRIRLLNVDAPELANCGGEEAKARLKQLVMGRFVSYDESVVDKFGRLVASVYVNDDYVNEIMLQDGWGVFEGRKTAGYENLKKASSEAKQKALGIYGPKCYQKENPDNPKCKIKRNHDKNSSLQIYHFPGCSGYEQVLVEKFLGDEWFCNEQEAKQAGYQKSDNCYGKIFTPR